MTISLPFYIPQLVKSLPSLIPEARKRYPFQTEPPRIGQARSQGLFPGLGAGREKTLALAGHVSSLHPEILGVIN